MKKIASIALALTIAAAALPAVVSSAEEGPSPTFQVAANRGDWEVYGSSFTAVSMPSGTNFALYVLGNAIDGEATISADLTVGQEYGFMFGITDANGDRSIAEGDAGKANGDQYYLVDLRKEGKIGIERNDKKWDSSIGDNGWIAVTESVVANAGETVSVSATYKKTADKVTITVSVGDDEVLTYEDTNPFVGVAYGLASKAKGDKGEEACKTQAQTMRNVTIPDKVGTVMSQTLLEDVIANNPRIKYKAGSAAISCETSEHLGSNQGSIEDELTNLLDDSDNTRFCVKLGEKPATITWETETAEVATYFVIYTGWNGTINRSAVTFQLYGSTTGNDGDWHEIVKSGRLQLKMGSQPNTSYHFGIHLDNETAFNHYKFEFNVDEQVFESVGINLFAAKAQQGGGENPGGGGENPGGGSENPGGGGENPGGETPPPTGSASIVIAAVATIALAGVVVASRRREQD